eukprot:gnl/TRDRNA2_/TRDRNA2_61191_c0_seq1.p1 gnl/TRDRNA2_/TRDRNA2_61191_c0~~gnl/TRDRNA2_/TRDRNA2_61191_c0_seq1.p1  ORF type:complete len:391 (-),score=66.20 gnl/TRDRNA2_/TRDRNA2_61191_c0_seq1:139-1311(-)
MEQATTFRLSAEQLKSKLKEHLVRGEDGRLHGEQRFRGKVIDSLIDAHVVVEERFSLTAEDYPKHFGGPKGTYSVTHFRNGKFPYTLENLAPLTEGSVVARRLYCSRWLAEEAFVEFTAGNGVGAVQLYAAAYRLDDLPVAWVGGMIDPAIETFGIIANGEESTNIRADAFLVLSFLFFFKRDSQHCLQSILAAQQLAPDDHVMYFVEGNFRNSLGQFDAALAALDRALELGSSHEALFVRGDLLEKLKMDDMARETLEEYIRRAPPEERKVCEAHYHLAVSAATEGTARRCLERGLAAEEMRLPCYPKVPSNYRRLAEARSGKFHACGCIECPNLGKEKCSGCGTVRYCSRECQKKDWTQHKLECQSKQKATATSSQKASVKVRPKRTA